MSETKKLTPKQQRFCDEYLIDLNATQAAIRAGYSKSNLMGRPKKGYYVYFLINPLNDRIFYVGKGKGRRALCHESDYKNGNGSNSLKKEEIGSILESGNTVKIFYFGIDLKEEDAFLQEGELIREFRDYGLTNIMEGCQNPIEVNKAWARHSLKQIIPFDIWMRIKNRSETEIQLYKMLIDEFKRISKTGDIWDLRELPKNVIVIKRGGEVWLKSA